MKNVLQPSRAILAAPLLLALSVPGLTQDFNLNILDIPGGAANSSNSENIDFGDVDGDGDWDIAIANGGDSGNQQNQLWLNLGPGIQVGEFQDVTATQFPAVNDSSRDIEFADIDSDSDLDIYVANHSSQSSQPCRWWVNTGAGFYADETSTRWVGLGATGSSVAPALVLGGGGFIDWSGDGDFADLDNDGDLDLFHSSYGGFYQGNTPSRIFLNDGAGFFSEFNPSGVQLARANILNGTPGIWCEGTQAHNTLQSDGATCDIASNGPDIDLGDVDGDFDLDVLHGSRANSPRLFTNRLEENGGTLGFRDRTGVSFAADFANGNGKYEQEMGDLDGDGDLDILGINWATSFGFVDNTLRNNGAGFFGNVNLLSGSGADDEEGDMIDYDNDGALDLFIANFSGRDRLYSNAGGSPGLSFTDETIKELPIVNVVSRDGEVCDVDNDGDYDILVASGFNQANVYYENVSQVPDTTSPYIPSIEQAPNRTPGPEPTVVRAQVYGNAPYYITWYNSTVLVYTVDGGPENQVSAVSSGGQIFRAEIPGGVIGTVQYWFTSTDEYDNIGSSASRTYLSDSGGTNSGASSCDCSGGNSPCGNTSSAGRGCPNSNANGLGAMLVGAGHASVSSDSFMLSVTDAAPVKPGLVLAGTQSLGPFGNSSVPNNAGLLCVGGSTARGDVVFTDAAGAATFPSFQGAPYGASSLVNAGSPVSYTHWFRDPATASGCTGDTSGADFNFSNGWTVVWLP